ncbi:MAG: DUF3644 domain-containing protein [Clostridiales bacterium]|nr:DUF3644 domain-containing protein [Clostridiales bacterium]
MAKRNMILTNMLKNSSAAYFAAIELHNKPNIQYRYESVVLLLINAWELALKAFVRKYIKSRSIFLPNNHTIPLNTALSYVNEYINTIAKNSFTAIKENILFLEDYRNNIAHYYCDHLEPYIFMLIARSALNYTEFMKKYFSRDIFQEDNLFILPLGFKLPFKPEEFLSREVAKYGASDKANQFISKIVASIKELNNAGIDDSIVLGFSVQLESIKKATNRDLLVAITAPDVAAATIARTTRFKLTNDPNAQVLSLSDEEFRSIWKYNHSDVCKWCKENVIGFRQGSLFNDIKRSLKCDSNLVFRRRLDSHNIKSPSQDFYTDLALEKIKKDYETQSTSK